MSKKKSGNDLKDVLTKSALVRGAGRVYYGRGEDYFERDLVENLNEKDGAVHALVLGTHPYKTILYAEEGELDGECSCPLGQRGEFCKHLVATGLACIERQKQTGGTAQSKSKSKAKTKPVSHEEIRSWLSAHPKSELVEIIMDKAQRDYHFYDTLTMKFASESGKIDITEMRRKIRRTMRIDYFIAWNETREYSRGVHHVLNQLKELIQGGQAVDVIGLAEYAMEQWEKAIQLIDDSDGCMGIILDDLHEIHLSACKEAKPEPVDLAERLFRIHTESEWDMFDDAYNRYRAVLGKKGRARFRELAESAWKKWTCRTSGDDKMVGQSRKLMEIMLTIAEESKNLDRIIDILSTDLSYPYSYYLIAERCRKAKKYSLALEWAEKGVKAFPDTCDSRLQEFLAKEYLRAKRPDEAMEMIWMNFTFHTHLETYKDLASYAKKLRVWPKWRDQAIQYIRSEMKREKHSSGEDREDKYLRYMGFMKQQRHYLSSLLVEIFLWEKKPEEAWTEAQKGGCSEILWLTLAKQREKTYPEDAIKVYKVLIKDSIERTNNDAYRQAINHLGVVNKLMTVEGKEKAFSRYVDELKTVYKRKRNFIKYLKKKSWGK